MWKQERPSRETDKGETKVKCRDQSITTSAGLSLLRLGNEELQECPDIKARGAHFKRGRLQRAETGNKGDEAGEMKLQYVLLLRYLGVFDLAPDLDHKGLPADEAEEARELLACKLRRSTNSAKIQGRTLSLAPCEHGVKGRRPLASGADQSSWSER